MTVLESTTIVKKSIDEVYAFLADLNNHEKLMPENISNWSSTKDEAKFTIKNMAKLALKVSNRVDNQEIVIIPSEEAPFPVELKWNLFVNSDNTTTVTNTISAELNMMMKMMAKGPLQKLADHQTEKLQSLFI